MSNLNSQSLFSNESSHFNFMKASPNIGFGGMNNNYMSFGANKNYQRNMMSANYDMAYSAAPKMSAMMAKKSESDNSDSDNNDKKEYKSSYKAKEKSARYMEEKEADYLMGANYDMEECDDECDDREGSSPIKAFYNEVKMEEKEEPKLEKKTEEKKVEFSNKELVLTQDIFDGCWNLNPQTKLLIEKEKDAFNKIEALMKEKNIDKEEVKMTLLVLYYLNTNSSINKVEYMLIIKKGISYLNENGIKFDEIFAALKN
jgi:hypothetical protein